MFISSLLANFFGYLTRAFLARIISPEEFGLFYSIFTFFMFLAVFAEMGYSSALVKFIPDFLVRGKRKSVESSFFMVLNIRIFLSLFLSFGVFLFVDKLAVSYFKVPEVSYVIIVFLLFFILNNIFSFMTQAYLAFQRMMKYSICNLGIKLFFLFFVILFYFVGFGEGVLIPSYAYLAAVVVFLFANILPLYRMLRPKRFFHRFSPKLFGELSLFALPTLFTSIGGMIIGYIDVLILTYYVSLEKVGIYNTVLPTILIIAYFSSAVVTIFFPMVSELWAKRDKNRIQDGMMLIYRYSILFAIPACAVAFFYSGLILKVLFGGPYISGGIAMKLLVPGVFFLALAQINFSVLSGIGKPKYVTYATLATAFLNTILNFVLIPHYGIEGAALTTTLSYVLMFAMSYIYVRKDVRIYIHRLEMLKLLLSAGLLSLLFYICQHITKISLIAEIMFALVSLFIFSVFVFSVRLVTWKDIRDIFSALLKKVR